MHSRRAHAAGLDALLAARQWIAELRGSALAAPALDAPSVAHAKTLRRIAELTSRAPRHERNSLAELAARCRLLVQAARGSGAERTLVDWIETFGESAAAPRQDSRAQLDLLAAILRPFDASRSVDDANAVLVAMLVVHSG
jgi:hypothetical protein